MTKKMIELYKIYKDCLLEAQSLWLSDYCNNAQEREERIVEDKERLDWFISLLKEIVSEAEGKQ